MLQKICISNKLSSFELSIYQKTLEKIAVFTVLKILSNTTVFGS